MTTTTANELADWIENGAPFGSYEGAKKAVIMLRQQAQDTMHLLLEINRLKAEILVKDTEIETLKMGFVGNGTADSELAETRAMANRMSLTIKKQQEEIEALKPYKEKIEEMERRYDDHIRKALGK